MKKPVDALVLTVTLGVLLVMPPLILLFNKPVTAFGLPLSVLYLFGVWALLVAISRALSRRLPADDD